MELLENSAYIVGRLSFSTDVCSICTDRLVLVLAVGDVQYGVGAFQPVPLELAGPPAPLPQSVE